MNAFAQQIMDNINHIFSHFINYSL